MYNKNVKQITAYICRRAVAHIICLHLFFNELYFILKILALVCGL